MKIKSTNPSRNYECIGFIDTSTKQDIENAVVRARRALATWSSLSLSERCKRIITFIEISKKKTEEIAMLIAKETGRPIVSSRANVVGGIEYFEAYIKMADKYLSPEISFSTDTETHRIYHEPRGVIAAICPWNYPYMNVVWQCGQALLAGNTIVYKNSEENPLFSKKLEECLDKSAIPAGVFNIVYGDGKVGEYLVHQKVDMISFTGSTKVGILLTRIAAEKFIPVVTELGGSSPLIVFGDTKITSDLISYIAERRFKNAGQACDAVKRLIVHNSKYDQIVRELSEYVSKQKIGDALDEATDIGPLISKRQVNLIKEQVFDAVSQGARVIIGGTPHENLKGAYYMPTILTNIKTTMRVWREETFGPVLPVVSFSTEEEAIQLANDTVYGLTAHVFTHNKKRFQRVASRLQVGAIGHNMVGFWDPRNPFGGYKMSGMGRVHGSWGFHDFTQVKVVSEER